MNRRPTGPLPADIELFDPTTPSFWQRIKYPLRWLTIGAVIALLIFAFRRYELAQYVDQDALRALIVPYGSWAPAVFIGVFVLAMLCVVVPFSVPCALGVMLFGVAWGTLWNVVGGTCAALAVFGLARLLGKRVMQRRAGDARWDNLNQRLQQDGLYYLLLVRALSIVPFNLLNFVSAFTALRLRDFILANLIGLIPSAFVYGYGAKVLLDPATPKTTLVAFVAVALVLLVTPLVFRQARRQCRRDQRQRIHEAFQHFK
ncbi:MAG: TVP38/TMEM64 family protein [Candidatus Sericytochromatia bacterium]